MEKYEINKYFASFEKRIDDLYVSFSIEKNEPILDKLTHEMEMPLFWDDQEHAQSIISKINELKANKDNYLELKKDLKTLYELDELASLDTEYQESLESEILEFDNKLNSIEEKALLCGKYDNTDAILEIHPGAGGTESMDWADMLYRMYQRYASKKGFKFKTIDYLAGEEAGIKSVTVKITGKYAYGLLKGERGVHRLVRISPFDSNSRRHTSFASVDVYPNINESDEIVINDADLKIDVFHSSGAGGQSVNTTDSAVRITYLPTNIVVTCQNERSQIQNREVAMSVLKSKLLEQKLKQQDEEMKKLKGEQMDIGFGSQIRSYVFCPYTLVKDHRTNAESGNVQAVMDGDLDLFVDSYLKYNAGD